MIGIVLIISAKNKKHEHDAKAVGYGLILCSVVLILPILITNTITDIKEKAIIQYIQEEVEVIDHGDSTYTFLWFMND